MQGRADLVQIQMLIVVFGRDRVSGVVENAPDGRFVEPQPGDPRCHRAPEIPPLIPTLVNRRQVTVGGGLPRETGEDPRLITSDHLATRRHDLERGR